MNKKERCLHCEHWKTSHVLRLIGKCIQDDSIKLSIHDACKKFELHEEVAEVRMFAGV